MFVEQHLALTPSTKQNMISDQDKSMFKESKSQEVAMLPRSRAMRFTLVLSRTQAFAKSPIPQMVALANRMADTEEAV